MTLYVKFLIFNSKHCFNKNNYYYYKNYYNLRKKISFLFIKIFSSKGIVRKLKYNVRLKITV